MINMNGAEFRNRALGEYQDLYFRWRAARRDYPFLDDPPPAPPRFVLMSEYLSLRDSLDREFARRT